MAYIEQPFIEGFLDFVNDTFGCVAMLDYDMYNPFDPFGKMMLHNFKQRGIPLVGMPFFSSLADIKQHYEKRGMTCEIHSMRQMYYELLDQEERKRIEKLEFLDELEEFWLVQEHYFMSLAKKSISKAGGKSPAEINLNFDLLSRLHL